MAASEAAKDGLYLSGLARELGLHDDGPIDLKMDNKSGIDVAYNPEHFSRMKHVARRHFFVRECVEDGRIVVPYVPTADNPADFFTKPLPYASFHRLREKIMNSVCTDGPSRPSRGGVET